MYCTKCGAKLPDGAKFCTECGSSVVSVQDVRPYTVPVSPEPERSVPFYRRIYFWIIVLILFGFPFVWFALNPSEAPDPPPPARPEVINPIDADCFSCHVSYLDYKIINDSRPRIMVYYRFENRSEKDNTYTFNFCTTSKAFQDGAMLDYSFGSSAAEKDCRTRIKPGASIVVCESYYLRNLQSPVEVTLSEYVPFFITEMGTMTIPLK